MPLIALTGGIASGKSTIARRFAEHGAIIVDADAVVRDVQQPGSPVLAAIAQAFGDDLIDADGALRRAALGERVFGDPDAIARLNAIVHPAVRTESKRRMQAALDADPDAVVVYDVPLLAESRGTEEWDHVVVADAPADVRLERLVGIRGLDRASAAARIASQATDEERRALADSVIDTSGTLEETIERADTVWRVIVGAR